MGNKKELRLWVEALAARGIAPPASPTGWPDHVFPAQIEDCKTAVRFLRTNADTYGIDKDRSPRWATRPAGTWPAYWD